MDKTSKKLLDYIKQLPNQQLLYTNPDIAKAANELNIKSEDVIACIESLIDKKYLRKFRYSFGLICFGLSHTSKHQKEFNRINKINYFKDNWIGLLALIISIISLVISLY